MCVGQQGKGVPFGIYGTLLQSGVNLSPGNGGRVHAEGLGDFHFHVRTGGPDLETCQIASGGDRLTGGHKVTITVLAEHDNPQADLCGNVVEIPSKLTFIERLVHLLLMGGTRNIGQIEDHEVRSETGHIWRGTGGHFKGPSLNRLHGDTIAAQDGVAEQLDLHLALGFLFNDFLKLLIPQGHIVAGGHRVGQADLNGLCRHLLHSVSEHHANCQAKHCCEKLEFSTHDHSPLFDFSSLLNSADNEPNLQTINSRGCANSYNYVLLFTQKKILKTNMLWQCHDKSPLLGGLQMVGLHIELLAI